MLYRRTLLLTHHIDTSFLHHIQLSSLLRQLLAVAVSHFPCFWWPWQFGGELVRYFVECLSAGICVMFSWKETSEVWWGEDHREVLLPSYQEYLLWPWRFCWCWLRSPSHRMFLGFLLQNTLLLFPFSIIWQQITKCRVSLMAQWVKNMPTA